MKPLLAILLLAACAGSAFAQSDAAYTPTEYNKALIVAAADTIHGAQKSRTVLEKALLDTRTLLPKAPNAACANAAQANICTLLLRLGEDEAAMQNLAKITDPSLRTKKRLELTFYLKGTDACLGELAVQLLNSEASAEDRLIWVEKVANLVGLAEGKSNQNLVNISMNTLSVTVATEKNTKQVVGLLKLCEKALEAGTAHPEKLKAALKKLTEKSQSAECIAKAGEIQEHIRKIKQATAGAPAS